YSFGTGSDGTLTINKAPLAATAADKSKEYGDANPPLTGSFDSGKGPKNGDLISLSYSTTALTGSSVGAYPISVQVSAAAGVLGNYQTPVLNDGTLTINKAPLAAKADDKSKVFNASNPPLTGS